MERQIDIWVNQLAEQLDIPVTKLASNEPGVARYQPLPNNSGPTKAEVERFTTALRRFLALTSGSLSFTCETVSSPGSAFEVDAVIDNEVYVTSVTFHTQQP